MIIKEVLTKNSLVDTILNFRIMNIYINFVIAIAILNPILFFSQGNSKQDTIVNYVKLEGSFLGVDSLLGLSAIKVGRYEIAIKYNLTIDTAINEYDTLTTKHGSSIYYDEKEVVRRVEHFLDGERIGPMQCFDKRGRLWATFWVEKGEIAHCTYYKKGRVFVMYEYYTSDTYMSKTDFRRNGRMLWVKRYYNYERYSHYRFNPNGTIRELISFEDLQTLEKLIKELELIQVE